jgi:hypothetical protein
VGKEPADGKLPDDEVFVGGPFDLAQPAMDGAHLSHLSSSFSCRTKTLEETYDNKISSGIHYKGTTHETISLVAGTTSGLINIQRNIPGRRGMIKLK